jgi:1,4-alpha-glucan branching enzyme
MMYAFSENYVLPLSHDEVVHGKGSIVGKVPGDRWQQMATVRALYAFMWAHPGKQLLFMGSEFAQYREMEREPLSGLAQPGRVGPPRRVRRGAGPEPVYAETRALWSQDTSAAGFSWIDANDRHGNVFSFLSSATTAR